MDSEKRYQRVWTFLRWAARAPLSRIYAYSFEPAGEIAGPYLVVANHNTDLDPALVGLSFPRQMFFVASEHVFRMGFLSKLLTYLFHPISRVKGGTDASAALDIVRALKKGGSVCLFAEGNRSYNGVTGPVFPATGKLARMSGASLVTYRLEGGYLTTPRWAHTLRRGRMHGSVRHVYSPETLRAMTPEAVNEAIRADLAEDAFARQAENPVAYRGKRLAEGLENTLYLCPACGGFGTLRTAGDRLTCACGMEAVYTEFGTFAGEKAPFANVRDWDAWQTEKLRAMAADPALTLTDDGLRLLRVGPGHRAAAEAEGRLTMSRERLTLGARSFSLSDIPDMALVGRCRIVFTAGDGHYEISRSSGDFCARKYSTLYQIWKETR